MIESIYQIGQALLEGTDEEKPKEFLQLLYKRVWPRQDEKSRIAKVQINTESPITLDIDIDREITDEVLKSCLWIGNPTVSKDPRDRLTINSPAAGQPNNLFTQTLPNLISSKYSSKGLKKLLRPLLETAFLKLGESSLGAYQYILNIMRFAETDKKLESIIEKTNLAELQRTVKTKAQGETIAKLVRKIVDARFKIGEDVRIFTLEVNGEALSQNPFYHRYLQTSILDSAFKVPESKGKQKTKKKSLDVPFEGISHLNSNARKELVTSNPRNLKFKYFITDKINFASHFSKNSGFSKTLALNYNAYKALLVGESFVERELHFKLANTNGLILPQLYFDAFSSPSIKSISEALHGVKKRFDFNLGLQPRLEREILKRKIARGTFSINLLFYVRKQASFKVTRLIQDVPEYRLYELRRQGNEIKETIGDKLFGESEWWELTLLKMYFLLPVRVTKENNKRVDHSRGVLEFYATLITNGLVDYHQLIQDFMELARVYRFGHPGYQVSGRFKDLKDKEKEKTLESLFRNYLAQSNLLLAFLRAQKQLKEETVSLEYLNDLDLNARQREYLEKLHYSRDQTALYLLGVIVGEIANAQYHLGEGGRDGKKVILNKLNYQGMSLNRVRQLTTELFNKLRQYKTRSKKDGKVYPLLNARNEAIIAQAQELLPAGMGEGWKLTPSENVYYILSGYTHTTFQAMRTNNTDPPKSAPNEEGGL
jgi:CRISPR-associated protein Csh1